jgi:hypothetical protein
VDLEFGPFPKTMVSMGYVYPIKHENNHNRIFRQIETFINMNNIKEVVSKMKRHKEETFITFYDE